MDIKQLESSLQSLSGNAYPVDEWKPQYCGAIDITIDAQGQWFHEGSPFLRDKLTVLFSKILTKDSDKYFLISPAEKLEISVEDAPFIVVDFQIELRGGAQTVWLITNIGDRVPLSNDYSINLKGDQQRPYLTLWRGLDALIERNTYYQLIDCATEVTVDGGTHMMIKSQHQTFNLGRF